ncbi:hypothetical protein ACHAWU_000616 [Discostella pseudostelligera]|uniref:Uncharacterized protein n=1 Tax=Discostella pseudostelligera TaxID=259834 RepID=A0ABD3M7S4_9STRA
MSLMSERRLADVDRRRRTSTSRSSSGGGGGGGSGHNDHPLTRRRRSCSTERATPITRRNTTATSSSSASVELGSTRYQRSLTDLNSSFKREDAFAIHRTSADMSRLRRERSHSQEPRHNHRRRPSSDSRTSPSMSLRSSNSLDGIGTRRRISGSSTVSTSYTPKHTTSNHHRSNQPQSSSSSCSSSVPRRSRSQSQDRYDGMTRRSSRSQSQERCGGGMTRKSSRSQSPDRCGGVPQRSSRSQSRDRCARSTTTTRGSTTLPSSSSSSHSHQKQQPPPPPPPPPRRVSASTADSIASERLLRLSQKICSMKESRRSSSSDTPSYVSISTQSQTTGTASPASSCSTGVTFRNTPASAGAVPMPRPRDDPPPPPPPRFTRRASSGRDVMLSSLESSKLMSSSCPTLAIVPTNDEKSSSNRPKKAINNNRKCSQKVSRMTYTDPFGNAGLYTGEVDEKSCPHGYGQMRYDNGAYFEGSWVYGCKNDNGMGPKNTNEISTMGTTITANDGFGNSQMILATVPPAVICPTNGNDNKSNKLLNKNTCPKKVSKMAYTDPFGDAGLYTGEVDEESRPHGKGKMKYDNGIYFEGNWVYGCKNDCMGLKNNGISTMGGASTTSCIQQNSSTRERILSGFTSWKGKKNADSTGNGEKGRFVYGMDWVDPAGLGGKYTGRVDDGDVPDGKGVMRYHFGLIAEGDWIKGVLNNGAGAGVNPIMAGNPAAMPGAMSVAPGMSVVGGGGGAMSVVSGLGMMSIGGGGGAMMGMGSYTTTPSVAAGVYNRMVNPYSNMIAVIPQTPIVSVGNPLGLVGNQGGYFPQNQMTHPQVPSGPAMDVAPQPSNTLCRQ